MSKICRTCLQRCHRTYKINQSLSFSDNINQEVTISVVLRFCIPELYLGVSSNPEICSKCREHLRVAYQFKKRCLASEQIIGSYLKSLRYTGRSIDLHDILAHMEEEPEDHQTKAKVVNNAQDIISDWEEPELEAGNDSSLLEVRQSAPNPTNSLPIATMLKFPDENREDGSLGQNETCKEQASKESYEWTGNSVRIQKKNLSLILNDLLQNEDQSNKEQPQEENTEDNFLKITSVFSLSENTEKENSDQMTGLASEDPLVKETVAQPFEAPKDSGTNLLEIKDEPLDVEINGERINFDYPHSDEETLDASETEDLRCDSSLQGIIDSIPEINDCNQYVDVPDFVQINNFGLRELEELRRQQKREEEQSSPIAGNAVAQVVVSNVEEALKKAGGSQQSSIYGLKMVRCRDGGYKVVGEMLRKQMAGGVQESSNKTVTCTEDIFHKLPEVLLVGDKKYVKSYDDKHFRLDTGDANIANKAFGYVQSQSTGTSQGGAGTNYESALKKAGIKDKPKAGSAETADKKQPRRRRKRLKIVPVDKFLAPQERKKNSPKVDDRDIVVLFTNYTYDGYYINDHDYLVNPYKRNKVLIETPEEWVCMCYICHTQHPIHTHVKHMSQHDTKCRVCMADLGTTYMLNVHVRAHTKPCRLCTEKVPYGLSESHAEQHVQEEMEFEEEKKVKTYSHLRTKKRKVNKDEKPVYFPIPHVDETERGYNSVSEAENLVKEEPLKEERDGSEDTVKVRRRGRKRKNTAPSEEASPAAKRVLRSNARKSYNETDPDVSAGESVEDILSTTGPP